MKVTRSAGLLMGAMIVVALLLVVQIVYVVLNEMVYVEPGREVDESLAVEISSPTYLHDEEAVVIEPTPPSEQEVIVPITNVLFEYIEVIDSCGPHYEGECVNVRSGPGTEYPAVAKLRNHVVLKVGGSVEYEGRTWYKIVFDEWLRYPERVTADWYVAADFVRILYDEGIKTIGDGVTASSSKAIYIYRAKQRLVAKEGEEVFMDEPISTGLALTPTPAGTFTIFRKTPSRYMQGPLPFAPDQYYDLPGVPWNLYFTHQGAVIHGAYWHTSFGSQYSHGCVNLSPANAEKLYNWAELGTRVTVE